VKAKTKQEAQIMRPRATTQVINRKRYNTETATLLASNAYWDGHNFERQGRNSFLYRTPKGAYFALHLTRWQGEHDTIEPLTQEDALDMYEGMAAHDMAEVSLSDAFPGVEVEDA
jgi:hypothetical protein